MHNLVTVLAWEHGDASVEHVAEVVALVESWCAEFVALEQRLDEECAVGRVWARQAASG